MIADERREIDQTGGSWNHVTNWPRRVEALREAAWYDRPQRRTGRAAANREAGRRAVGV